MSYITRRPKPVRTPRAGDWDWLDDMGGPSQITVHEPENEAQPTGLLDYNGNEICRVRDRLPMGFRAK